MTIFAQLHVGNPENPTAVHIAVDDIRLVRPKVEGDGIYLENIKNPEAYKTCLLFKGDGWMSFVHEVTDDVIGICGLKVSQ